MGSLTQNYLGATQTFRVKTDLIARLITYYQGVSKAHSDTIIYRPLKSN